MKTICLCLALLFATGCRTSNDNGVCVGVLDQKKPGVEYELSIRNVALAVIFSETIVIPVIVVAKLLECPRG